MMKKLFARALCALTLLAAVTACDDGKKQDEPEYPDFEQLFSGVGIETTPEILEAVGGKVPVTIDLTIPAGVVTPTAEGSITPFVVWHGGEVAGQSAGFIGEVAPDMGCRVISYKEGGSIKMKASFDYKPEMAKSELILEFSIRYEERATTFRRKITDGVIATWE